MFEWPEFKSVDMENYPRRALYEHFNQFEIPISSRTIQIDVTRLKKFAKENNLKFSLTLGFIITRANNHVPEFLHRIQNGQLVEFEKVIPSYTVLSESKQLYFSKGVFTDDFLADYKMNIELNDRAAKGLDPNAGSNNMGQIFMTFNPWASFTALQPPYTSRFASVPVYGIGKMVEENGKIRCGLSIQNHHGLTDGYHVGHLIRNIERHLESPELVFSAFESDFNVM